MSLDSVNRINMINKYIDKSDKTWKEAEAAKQLCMWPMTANRMYYSLVNAMRALLLVDGHSVHTHAGMKSAIGQHYVLTQELTISESKLFSQMETMREKADYDCFFDASETDVEEKFIPTFNLIQKVKTMVSDRVSKLE